ncbi:ribosomal RNA small subunit methyltransferase NEP1 [Petromyzon marinus]|uniref:ribosomal RNA small subunit methyltransferase NEP1 n=1 Tax=Petromyzon marinus TaxID=7757 RepID=UPI003F70EBB4
MAARRRPHAADDAEEASEAKMPRPISGRGTAKGGRRLVVVLEGAALETVKQGKSFELLNCDKHKSVLKRLKRDPGSARPDITHQCLLMLLDSPLNRAGMLQVFIHTASNVLIQVNPQTRIPRTFDRFCGLMVQLLHKLSVRASDGPQKLLRVIKNPVSEHLPVGCPKVSTSFQGEPLTPRDLLPPLPSDEPIVVVIGAFAHGAVSVDYTERTVSISSYPLSAALTCSKLCSACEEVWGVQ